ncbi:MAG: PadR family transcriptional regulator [Kutzneria sp.]|nr:PadR family transcriptional regulator [Kutzneria sp.]MBV9845355.1 PadR family transcriptional regulator [Kutzneria sp.]
MAGFLGRGGRRGGRRQRRGNVRAAVLALLAERPMHGYEMIQELAQRTHGLWKPSPGSVYPTLQLLTDEGLITAAEQGGKRLFTLTESGNAEVANQASSTPWAEVAGDVDQDAMQLHTALSQLFMAVDQISQAGTEEQKTKAVKAINDAKRRIYELLAQDDEVDDVDEED